MFTGIVEEIGGVLSVSQGRLVISADETIKGIKPGGSIAINGVCLTARELVPNSFSVDIMPETARKTNLGMLNPGDRVNLERPLSLGGELGGHLVQGHIDGTGKMSDMAHEGDAILLRFEAPAEIMRYIVSKGFIAVDGVSLTVVDVRSDSFSVSVVGYTREHTTLGDKQIGDIINLEVDIIAKYVERFFQASKPGITFDFLKEHGFLAGRQ